MNLSQHCDISGIVELTIPTTFSNRITGTAPGFLEFSFCVASFSLILCSANSNHFTLTKLNSNSSTQQDCWILLDLPFPVHSLKVPLLFHFWYYFCFISSIDLAELYLILSVLIPFNFFLMFTFSLSLSSWFNCLFNICLVLFLVYGTGLPLLLLLNFWLALNFSRCSSGTNGSQLLYSHVLYLFWVAGFSPLVLILIQMLPEYKFSIQIKATLITNSPNHLPLHRN